MDPSIQQEGRDGENMGTRGGGGGRRRRRRRKKERKKERKKRKEKHMAPFYKFCLFVGP